MSLKKICCCCFQSKDQQNVNLESNSTEEPIKNPKVRIPSISVTVTPEPIEPQDKNKPIFIRPSTTTKTTSEQPIIEQPKSTLKVETTDKDKELKAKQPNIIQNVERDKNVENRIITNNNKKRPASDSRAYDLKKTYDGYNNFAFVDEIDNEIKTTTTTTSATNTNTNNQIVISQKDDDDLVSNSQNSNSSKNVQTNKKTNIVINRNENHSKTITIENGGDTDNNCTIHITSTQNGKEVKKVININPADVNSDKEIHVFEINEINEINDDGEITPPRDEELDFDTRRKLMMEKSFEQFFNSFNKKTPKPIPRKNLNNNNKKDEIDFMNDPPIYKKPKVIKTISDATSDNYKNIRLSCLEAHNRLRAQHGCPSLKENDELNKIAEDWANYLMKNNCKLVHRPNNKYGENLYWTNDRNGHVTMAVYAWYDEIKLYNFKNPGFSKETGHFTQLLWRDTLELGTAVVKEGSDMIVVCNYNPPGNYNDEFNDYTVPQLIAEDCLTNDIIQNYIEKIRESSLTAHNRLRAIHGCPRLERSDELDRAAEVTLNYVEANNGKIPKLDQYFGRNCFWCDTPFVHVTQAVQYWYENGVKAYNYDQPGIDNTTGGFIQLIWRDTLQLGTDVRRIGKDIWVICVYNPSRLNDDKFNDYFIPRPVTDKLHLTLSKNSEWMRWSSLEAHNRVRALHGCPPLVQNPELDKLAEEWAKHLAEVNKLYHRANSKYGENLYWLSDKLGHVTMAVQTWYDEIKLYDYNNPNFTSETGHFTQLIWRDSVELGTGIARRGNSIYIVCLYNPPGNYVGRFNDYYVPRPIS